jgi:hypothetical protein
MTLSNRGNLFPYPLQAWPGGPHPEQITAMHVAATWRKWTDSYAG